MNECRGDDDAGAEVFGDEEEIRGDPYALVVVREDGEDGTCGTQSETWMLVSTVTEYGSFESKQTIRSSHIRSYHHHLPKSDPTRMTKIAETLNPIRPLKSFEAAHSIGTTSSGALMLCKSKPALGRSLENAW